MNRLYILVRTDLPSMNAGRAMAQASHASNAFIKKFGRDKSVQSWQRETKQGFGTVIVLAATIYEIHKVMSSLLTYKIKNYVTDPDYVIPISSEVFYHFDPKFQKNCFPTDDGKQYLFHREEITCAYVFGTREELAPYLGNLNLHP